MRKLGLIFLLIGAGMVIFIPVSFLVLIFFDLVSPNAAAAYFRETFFTLMPGFLLLGVAFRFSDKLTGDDKEKLQVKDYIWPGVLILAVIVYVTAYTSDAASVFNRIDAILPFAPALSPSLYTITLWVSFFLIILAVIFMYLSAVRTGIDKSKAGGLLIGFLSAVLFSLLLVKVPFYNTVEEVFRALLYSVMRNPATTIDSQTGQRYCPAPYDDTGNPVTVMAPTPDGVRDDIEIVGISNVTIEKVQGNWPLDWNHYADLTNLMSNAERNILLFDISFLDEKGVYGGNNCGVLFECSPIDGQPMVRQVDVLADAVANAQNIVVSDYPLETTDESRATIVNYDERMEILLRKEKIKHVKNGQYARAWGKLPLPPVTQIAENMDGLGYANILKSDTGMNREVPLVARVINRERMHAPDYDPNKDDDFIPGIDLVVAAQYYGVDPTEDIEVDFLEGTVTISNIPEKKYEKFNLQTFKNEVRDIMAVPNPERQVVIPIDRTGLMNINFRGGRYCFKFHEMLETNKLSPDDIAQNFSGKIMLVAMYYATGVGTAKDIHLSPYGDMAGIEHHAYAINTILNQDFAYDTGPAVSLLILLITGLIMGLYLPRVVTWLGFVLTLGVAFVYFVVTLYITFDIFSLLHIFPTVLGMQIFALVAFIGFRVLTEEENVKFIRNTFSKFVSQDVVNELLANPEAIALGGSKKEVSVFFSDVRGFTTISEALGPEELVRLLNEYLSDMTELIIDYRGTIDKYMGDAIMAFWGAPAQNDDHAYYTCVAAMAQLRQLYVLQDRWKEQNVPALDIGIGINSGPAVVGNMGSSRRMDYTLMGDTVNLGSRLEGITKTYGVKICISEYTYERVKDRVYARELDLVRVKGKLEPVRIFELMGLVNDSDIDALKVSSETAQRAE